MIVSIQNGAKDAFSYLPQRYSSQLMSRLLPPSAASATLLSYRCLAACASASTCEKRLFSQLSLCLSRACLGKKIAFTYKLLKKRRFSHRIGEVRTLQVLAQQRWRPVRGAAVVLVRQRRVVGRPGRRCPVVALLREVHGQIGCFARGARAVVELRHEVGEREQRDGLAALEAPRRVERLAEPPEPQLERLGERRELGREPCVVCATLQPAEERAEALRHRIAGRRLGGHREPWKQHLGHDQQRQQQRQHD